LRHNGVQEEEKALSDQSVSPQHSFGHRLRQCRDSTFDRQHPRGAGAALEPRLAGWFQDQKRSEGSWPTLARMKWQYLNQVLAQSSSRAAAARQLGISPRSLRRMLDKQPPSR
jgi:hypothetical protein